MLLQNGNIYYYITNAQGDVIRLVDINGNVAASYRYDPYGKATSALGSHANINPLRYRGYVFDHETGLYYLQSRYYDPETGRFINADALVSTGQGLLGNNMFAYCLNNPVIYVDSDGRTSEVAIVAEAWAAGMWWLCLVDAYLPIGDAIYGVVLTVLLVAVAVTCTSSSVPSIDYDKIKQDGSEAGATSVPAAAGGTASPPPPNDKKPGIAFSKETVFKRVYSKGDVAIDYEYNGNGTGNVHMHLNGEKYHYDTRGYFKMGSGHSAPKAPQYVQRYLQNDSIVQAIMKALKILQQLGAVI